MALDIRFADASELETPARFFAAYAAVSTPRREKVDRLRSAPAKRLSLCAGLLLAETLRAHGVSPADALPAEGPYGKPYLPRRPDLHFSLSHSGTRAMCAVSDRPVGCDIQLCAPPDLRIAERFFSAEEQACIFGEADEDARQRMFFRIWTLKESFVKCIGMGLAQPLRDFSVFPDGDTIVLQQCRDAGTYVFSEPQAGAGYACACCVRKS